MNEHKRIMESYRAALENKNEAAEIALLPLVLGSLSNLETFVVRWMAAREYDQLSSATSRDLIRSRPGMSVQQASNILYGLVKMGLLSRESHTSDNGFFYSYHLAGAQLKAMATHWAGEQNAVHPGAPRYS